MVSRTGRQRQHRDGENRRRHLSWDGEAEECGQTYRTHDGRLPVELEKAASQPVSGYGSGYRRRGVVCSIQVDEGLGSNEAKTYQIISDGAG